MNIQVDIQWKYFVWSIIAGLVIGVIYDLLRLRRRAVRTNDFWVNIEDVMFFVVCGAVFFLTAYFKNDGELRWHGFLGAIIGFVGYKLLCGDIIVESLLWFMGILKSAITFLIKIILLPVIFLFKLFKKPVTVVAWYAKKGVKQAKSTVKTHGSRVKNLFANSLKLIKKK
ncbi:MAG: spore cortex biosynthesis protein YabQ [Oscillospiraceae bacterium]